MRIYELDFVSSTLGSPGAANSRSFYDYVINRTPLPRILERGGMTPFGSLPPSQEQPFVDYLLLRAPSPLASGRVPLYICEICADLGCGSLSVQVTRDYGHYVWSDFSPEDGVTGALDPTFPRVGPFHFEESAYEKALTRFGTLHARRDRCPR